MLSALWGQNPWPYILFRLRFFLVTTGLRTVTHAIELLIILNATLITHKLDILIIRLLPYVLSQGWWGITETLRNRVRALYNNKQLARLYRVREYWLSLSGVIATIIIVITVLCFGLFAWHHQRITFLACLLSFTFIYLGLQCVAQTLHASIYGFRRVYRTLFSMNVSHVAGLAVLLGCFHVLGIWSILLALIVESLLSVAFSIFYSLKTLKKLQQPAMRQFQLDNWRGYINFYSTCTGISSICLHAPVLLFMLLVGYYHSPKLYVIYAILPLLMATFTWFFLFYFDKKKFDGPLHSVLLPLWRRLIYLSVWINVVISVALSLVFYAYFFKTTATFIIIPLCLVNAIFMMHQFKFYCLNKHVSVICSFLILLLVIYVGMVCYLSGVEMLCVIMLAEILSWLVLWRLPAKQLKDTRVTPEKLISVAQFCEQLSKCASNLKLYRCRFNKKMTVNDLKRLLVSDKTLNHHAVSVLLHNQSTLMVLATKTISQQFSRSCISVEAIDHKAYQQNLLKYMRQHTPKAIARYISQHDTGRFVKKHKLFEGLDQQSGKTLSYQLLQIFQQAISKRANIIYHRWRGTSYRVVPVYRKTVLCDIRLVEEKIT